MFWKHPPTPPPAYAFECGEEEELGWERLRILALGLLPGWAWSPVSAMTAHAPPSLCPMCPEQRAQLGGGCFWPKFRAVAGVRTTGAGCREHSALKPASLPVSGGEVSLGSALSVTSHLKCSFRFHRKHRVWPWPVALGVRALSRTLRSQVWSLIRAQTRSNSECMIK